MSGKLTGQKTNRVNRAQIEATVAEIIPIVEDYIDQYMICGSYRRGKKESGDIDLIIQVKDRSKTVQVLKEAGFSGGEKWLRAAREMQGSDSKDKLVQVEVKLATAENFGAQIMWATGSSKFNTSINAAAQSKGLKRNQYGLWDGDKCLTSTEEGIFKELGLPFIPPEERQSGVVLSLESPDYETIEIKSSNGKSSYSVKVHLETGVAVFCPCKGFQFRQHCRHLEDAEEIYCKTH